MFYSVWWLWVYKTVGYYFLVVQASADQSIPEYMSLSLPYTVRRFNYLG